MIQARYAGTYPLNGQAVPGLEHKERMISMLKMYAAEIDKIRGRIMEVYLGRD